MPDKILITNDDGIQSGFLHAIATALNEHVEVVVAAPASEQSWIGRAVSRRRPVSVEPHPELPWPAWTIDGTPTDCVNIALESLLDSPPMAVVSGINIGYNTTIPLIYSSGTVAGALEGAFWGLPAFAVSQQIPDTLFASVTDSKGQLPAEWQPLLDDNARHAAGLILRLIHDRPSPGEAPDAVVHNLNYPSSPRQPYETVLTVPARLRDMPYYRKSSETLYTFHFQHGEPLHSHEKTDREALALGEISHSVLNFSSLGRDLNH